MEDDSDILTCDEIKEKILDSIQKSTEYKIKGTYGFDIKADIKNTLLDLFPIPYAIEIICDETNNTKESIERGETIVTLTATNELGKEMLRRMIK